jgi:putative serine protease PepD
MTSEHEPGRDDWSPWGQSERADETTQEVPQAVGEHAAPAPAWPAQQSAPYGTQQPSPYAAQQPASYPAPQAEPAWAALTAPPQPQPVTPAAPAQPETRRRGPGWGAVIGVSLAVALVAGLFGGLLGGVLADRGAFEPTGSSGSSAAPAPSAGTGATTRPEGSVANIAARTTPSVVTLRVEGGGGTGTGSGWVYDDRGHIVTNNHVVASAADGGEITVVLANGQQVPATIVGRDGSYDLAVVKVDRTDLAPLTLGRSADVVVGDQVIAVGAPLGLDSTVTSGIVSALDRPVTPGEADDQSFINAIQTDAAINPGNSGGPLLDMQGRVIGVNSAIARAPGSEFSGQSGNIGVGFAIPSDQVATTVEQLITTGKAVHPIIGVFLDSTYDGEGVRIADEGPAGQPAVAPDGPAAEAGLEAGDVVIAFEGRPVSEDGELVVLIRSRTVGEKVTLTILRGGAERDVTMVLEGSAD